MSKESKDNIRKKKSRCSKSKEQEAKRYTLTEWGCLYTVLYNYGITEIEDISPEVGVNITKDFMELMCKTGYIKKKE